MRKEYELYRQFPGDATRYLGDVKYNNLPIEGKELNFENNETSFLVKEVRLEISKNLLRKMVQKPKVIIIEKVK